jgi:hypothetical protein
MSRGAAPVHGFRLKRLFAAMLRKAGVAADCLRLSDNAVVELGIRVQI